MRVILARPRGFCAGVVRAIKVVERSLHVFDGPVYVRHEIVHNRQVVDDLQAKGAMSVEDLDAVPDGATVIFSAHGVSKAVSAEAERRGLHTIDGTCPLVTKVHRQVHRLSAQGFEILLIGHAGHPEVEGTMGQLAEKIDEWPHLTPPADTGDLTVCDVALADSVETHITTVEEWAGTVWSAWSEHQAEVADLVKQHLPRL